jgi:hypothetical protein
MIEHLSIGLIPETPSTRCYCSITEDDRRVAIEAGVGIRCAGQLFGRHVRKPEHAYGRFRRRDTLSRLILQRADGGDWSNPMLTTLRRLVYWRASRIGFGAARRGTAARILLRAPKRSRKVATGAPASDSGEVAAPFRVPLPGLSTRRAPGLGAWATCSSPACAVDVRGLQQVGQTVPERLAHLAALSLAPD